MRCPPDQPIVIHKPGKFPCAQLDVERIGVGEVGDYKPMIAKLKDQTLLMVAFRGGPINARSSEGVTFLHEDVLFFTSGDGGRSWQGPTTRDNVLPREPYVSVTAAGTLLMTIHHHPRDHRNLERRVQSYLYRSSDHGRTWHGRHLIPDEYPPGVWIHSSRNVLQLADGSLVMGVSSNEQRPDLLYRSTDDGRTWKHEVTRIEDKPAKYPDPLWAEVVFWQCRSGVLLALVRVNEKHWPIHDAPIPTDAPHDQAEHLVVLRTTDDGATWRWVRDLGGYGAMYPSLLTLHDGRLLLTYTQRSLEHPLGVRAVVGRESDDGGGIDFDFAQDVIIIDGQTPEGQSSGGGFGNTVQLDDGTLITPYSYRDADRPDTVGTEGVRMEVARWRLPQP